jgi:hypothetical protein
VTSSGNIHYKDALSNITLNLTSTNPFSEAWVLRGSNPVKKKDKNDNSLCSYGMTSVFSMKSKRTDIDNIIHEQQQQINRVK